MANEPTRNVILMLKNKRLGFPDLAEARAITGRDGKTGKPSFGARIIIVPTDPDVAVLDAGMRSVADFQWKENGEKVLKMLTDKGRVAFSRTEYCNKDGKVYAGFEGMFSLGASSPGDKRPTYFDEYGKELTDVDAIRSKLYAGCYANYKVELYPLLRDDGNRINCALLGVQFAGPGESFGGGSAPASAADFAGTSKALPDAEDVL